MSNYNPTSRFSDRAQQYSLYRPEYPRAIIDFLEQNIGLTPNNIIADIGSGTGIFSKLFLKAGYAVSSVEPNDEMRKQAETSLQKYPGFRSVGGTAEATTLPDHTVDLITVAQAFHWFRPAETRKEFERILKASGHVLLVWNILQSNTPFLKGYTALKETFAQKIEHPHRANLERIREIFDPAPVTTHNFKQSQQLDIEGLKGHLLSFSTVPLESDHRFSEMMRELERLFEQHNHQGLIDLEYETKIYLVHSLSNQS